MLLLVSLCASQVISWGTLYYALPATSTVIAAATGWTVAAITTAFSAGLILSAVIGIPIGRLLDRVGPRRVMTAGTLLGTIGLVTVAAAPSPPLFAAAWCLTGIAQAATLYQAAFTVINKQYRQHRARALTVLTLTAGLASTIFAPIAAALTNAFGWRDSSLVLAGILLVAVTPIHAFLVPVYWPEHARTADATADPGRTRRIIRSAPCLQVGITGLALALYAATLNLVPSLTSSGHTLAAATAAFGLVGIGQVAGRILFILPGARTNGTLLVTIVAVAALILLALVPRPFGVVVVIVLTAGAARGALTLVQASAVVDRWGTAGAGHLTAVFAAPVTIATAIAPAVGASLDAVLGTGGATILLALVSAAGGASLIIGSRLRCRTAAECRTG
ncbi:MFS transporter [Curtobacterium sp. 'Ferrero']|nr:MFS transporter [Curtobacterium sp. 'Ferrero']